MCTCASTEVRRLVCAALGLALAALGAGCQWDVGRLDIQLVHTAVEGQNPLDGVRWLRVRVEGEGMSPRVAEVDASAAAAEAFSALPVGQVVRVKVEGLNGSGYVQSRGLSRPFEVREGDQTLYLYMSLVGVFSGPPSATEVSAPGFADRFRTSSRSGEGRAFHAGAELPDGVVLLAGGVGAEVQDDPLARRDASAVLQSAERFDPTAGAFLLDSTWPGCVADERLCLSAGRAFFSLDRLAGRDTLLAVGGEPVDSEFAAETYEPEDVRFFPARVGMAKPRTRAGQVALPEPERAVVIAGGLDAAGLPLASVEVFDATLGTFAEIGALGEARAAPAMVSTPDGVLVIGGWSTFRDWPVAQAEDRTASARIDRIRFEGGTPHVESLGSLLHARAEASAVLLPDRGDGARVFVCGGLPGPGDALDSCELIDPATGASAESSRVLPRYRHTATLLDDGRVLIAGGFNKGGPASAYNRAEILDPLGGRVTVYPGMVANRAGHTAHLLQNGMVLLVGGQGVNGQPAIEDYELFNP
jgi:hypothetical protein